MFFVTGIVVGFLLFCITNQLLNLFFSLKNKLKTCNLKVSLSLKLFFLSFFQRQSSYVCSFSLDHFELQVSYINKNEILF